ncbi:leucine efflux protein LeuE [Biostraticola tofi]|uniref:Leucine efflux protein n=1 Tax=Biostraticola tofi TaxID=466109 RepID=A0A4R3Z881_9GAMM|nr:leucine efflux protein LeuE [Biostraticola tofi]TCW00270.1 leucine efflux protein [Biostraticola tofi]
MFESVGVINVWTYLAGLVFIIILPGPNSLYVLRTAAARGVKAGYIAASGVFLGDAMLIFCAYIGVASLINTTPLLFTLVRSLGALYLFYLGAGLIYQSLRTTPAPSAAVVAPRENIISKSLTLSLTNPKAILFYVSFFVQFIDFGYAHTWLSFTVLALILEGVSFSYLTLIIFSGTLLARFFQRKRGLAKIGNSLVGMVFLGFAARLAAAVL